MTTTVIQKKQRVALFQKLGGSATIDVGATNGAQVGVNLYDPNGDLVQWSSILNVTSSSSSSTGSITTTDELDEGEYNLYFTDLRAQDAVGSILANTPNIVLTYVAGTSISAN